MTSRVIALDLDGTLLTPQKTLLPSSLEALKRAQEAGYQLLIVTGRHHVAIHPFYQALALDTPAICCNGTYLYVITLITTFSPIQGNTPGANVVPVLNKTLSPCFVVTQSGVLPEKLHTKIR
jgi:hydroxymethylpyrimidine pyrophosphatase-like HAD family hydrolase